MHCTPSLQCAAPRGLWLFNNTSTPPWLVLKPKQQDANYQNQTWQTKTDSPFHCQTWISQSKTFLNPDLPDKTYPGTQEVSCVPTLPLTLVREWENLWVPGWTKAKGANIEMKAPNEDVVTVGVVTGRSPSWTNNHGSGIECIGFLRTTTFLFSHSLLPIIEVWHRRTE